MTITPAIERVTPDQANSWLEANGVKNRRLSKTYVDFLVQAMRDGTWKDNAESIKLTDDDKLVDGQHRLTAIVRSGRSLNLLVARGVEPDAYDSIDQGKPRRLHDALDRHGEKYAFQLSTAIRLYLVLCGELGLTKRLSNLRGLATLERHSGLRETLQNAVELGANLVLPFGWAAAVHYRCREFDTGLADEFWPGVFGGENLKRDQNAYKLRRRLIADKESSDRMGRPVLKALLVKAWLYEKHGDTLNAAAMRIHKGDRQLVIE